MKRSIHQAAKRMIGAYDLHRSVPVQLDPLDDLFSIRYMDMYRHGAMGAIITPQYGWPVTPQNRARILLDHNLGDSEARVTIAHEVGHALCEHPGNRMGLSLGLEDKHERQAWAVASQILIPDRVVYEEREAERIAAVCEVPLFMVGLWQSVRG